MCALGLFASSLFGLLVPWMTRAAIDGMSAPDGRARIAAAIGWMLVFAAFHGAFRYLSRRGLLATARRVEMRLRADIFSHVVRLPLSFFAKTPTGDVTSRLTNDVSAVWLFLGPGFLTLIGTVISYVLALAFMMRISIALTLVALAVAPLIVFVSRGYGRAFHRLHRKVQETLAAMNATLQENVTGIRLVKAYGLEEAEERRFGANCRDYYAHNVSVSRTSAAFHGAIGLLAGAGVALVLWLGSRLVIRGSLSLGGFVAFNAYLAMLSFPTMALGWVINLFERGGSAMGRINEFLRLPPEGRLGAADAGADAADAGEARGTGPARSGAFLSVRDLRFSYDGDGEGRGEVLRGVSFDVGRGEVAALVGLTGCGKSTLLSLLLGFHPAPPGTIFLEGRDIGRMPLDALRQSVAWVGQDPFLFSDTVFANIGYGLPRPDPAAVRRAAGHARILSEIEEMPEGLSTVIGERGISLSGGQKQRATLARALCAGGELLLLDDALSAVDAETEREIFDALVSAREGRTILFSTHRLASLARCDRILVMEEGRIAEQGTHDELLSRRGAYFDLYSRQMLSRELEEAP
ncbi:MAG: ABC transporter ATP-binding protein [Gemmatimonadota bacterium]